MEKVSNTSYSYSHHKKKSQNPSVASMPLPLIGKALSRPLPIVQCNDTSKDEVNTTLTQS